MKELIKNLRRLARRTKNLDELFFTPKQVRERLRVSRSTQWRMVQRQELRPVTLSGRTIGYLRTDIEALEKERLIK